jgi:hypothetical protein
MLTKTEVKALENILQELGDAPAITGVPYNKYDIYQIENEKLAVTSAKESQALYFIYYDGIYLVPSLKKFSGYKYIIHIGDNYIEAKESLEAVAT